MDRIQWNPMESNDGGFRKVASKSKCQYKFILLDVVLSIINTNERAKAFVYSEMKNASLPAYFGTMIRWTNLQNQQLNNLMYIFYKLCKLYIFND
jgi:hypothetical protein